MMMGRNTIGPEDVLDVISCLVEANDDAHLNKKDLNLTDKQSYTADVD